MRMGFLLALFIAIACLLVSCRTIGITGGPGGRTAWACTQCNVACTSAKHCPVCKGKLQATHVTRACPRCGMECGGRCPVCGVHSVPAIQYYKCPSCGKTLPSKGRFPKPAGGAISGPACPGCGWKMLPQTVPLRACCPDCGVWSSKSRPCPNCGLDMSPM
jgi:hypothetical protein